MSIVETCRLEPDQFNPNLGILAPIKTGRIPALLMGLGISLYGLERRMIKAATHLRRIEPYFVLSQWDLGDVSEELSRLEIPYIKASFGYMGFANLLWLARNIIRMPILNWKIFAYRQKTRAKLLIIANVGAFANALPVLIFLRQTSRAKLCFYLGDIGGGTRLQRFILRLVDRYADAIVANSQATKEGLRRNGIVRTPIDVVYNGVDSAHFASASPVDMLTIAGWPSDSFVFGYVGQLSESKGIEDFLQAARLIAAEAPKARFLIIGEAGYASPYRSRLELSFADLKERTHFAGYVKNIEQYYAAMNVVVVASRHEDPAPNVNLEAMAAGLPVIGTAIGGTKEQLVDGVTGFLVPPASPHKIHEKMRHLLTDPELSKSMGLAGRRRCRERFDWNQNVEILEAHLLDQHVAS
jgi:glycosyltransferase involved in cell wall biosynthesis